MSKFGFTYDRDWFFSGAVFYNHIRDMIESRINADFIKQNINVARARIKGFELEARKTFGLFSLAASYTFLDTEQRGDRRPAGPDPGFAAERSRCASTGPTCSR